MADPQWEGTQFVQLHSPAEVEGFLRGVRLAERKAKTA